jgi:hypothetical protein
VRRVFAVRCGLFGSITGGDVFTGLLPAGKAVVAGWRQPIRQGGEGLSAWSTDSTPHPNAFVLIIVTLTQPPPVADDRVITANRTSPRQEVQRDHPGSALSSASGSAIKRITAGVKAAADRRCQVSIWGSAFTLPVKSASNEKRILLSVARREPSLKTLAGYKRHVVQVALAEDPSRVKTLGRKKKSAQREVARGCFNIGRFLATRQE